MHRLTALARIVDPRLPSHRRVLTVATLSAIAAWGYAGGSRDGLGIAFNAGVASFLAWAIARELDPDRPAAGTAAAVISGVVSIVVGPSMLLVTVLALLTARILHRSTGLPPTLLDLLALLGVAYVGSRSASGWAVGLALAFAVARDHRLPDPAPRRQLLAAFLIAATATAGAVVGGVPYRWTVPAATETILLIAGVVAAFSLRIYVPVSVTDHTGRRIDTVRLQSARMGTLGTGVLAAALTGSEGIVALSPLWSAVIGVALWDRFGREPVAHPAPPE